MSRRWSLLCPVDCSPASLGALHYALAIARRFHVAMTVLMVDDRRLADVGDARMGGGWSHATTERELRAFVADAQRGFDPVTVSCEVRIGKAAPRILEVAREQGCSLIVMGTNGRTGAGTIAFGATTERVLRETTLPVLLAPEDPAEEIARWVRDKHAGLLIMALRSDQDGGPRMGSVTYRAIAMSRVLTLALPPAQPAS